MYVREWVRRKGEDDCAKTTVEKGGERRGEVDGL
jgi:hypothetical protein